MAIAGYKLRINGGSLVNEIIDAGNVLSFDPSTPDYDIDSNTLYAVEVAAYDGAGNLSAWSSSHSATTDHEVSNVALSSAGATIAANVESLGAGTKARVIDGIRHAQGNFNSTGGFQQNGDGNNIEITFSGSKTISEIDIFFGDSSDFNSTTVPLDATRVSTLAVVDYRVQYWNGSSYVTVVTITGNNKQWKQHTITPVATTKMKFIWDTAASGAAYLLEVECLGY